MGAPSPERCAASTVLTDTTARTCLLIAYYYPPGGGVGVQRALKFTKYLPEFGWRPVVLTANTPLGIPSDPTLSVPPAAVLYRAAPTAAFAGCFAAAPGLVSRLLAAAVLVPDPFIGWLPGAMRRGLKAIRNERPEVIIATSPPNSSQLLGWALSRVSDLPLVVDFRDAWVADPDKNRSLHNRVRFATIERMMERVVMNRASGVISVSDAILEDFRARYPNVPADAFSLIENGFDEEDLAEVERIDLAGFALVLTASMNKPNRSAAPILRGIAALFDLRPHLRSRVRVYLVGAESVTDRAVVNQLGLSPVVTFVGQVAHSRALAYQRAADVNVMVWDGPDDSRSAQMMSGKVFEYLGAARPILAVVPEACAAARMLRRIGGTHVVPPNDSACIAATLVTLVDREASFPAVQAADLQRFTRRHQAGRLAALLSAVARS
jgi:glycosyltransferase involved in cell wall biosynthesis